MTVIYHIKDDGTPGICKALDVSRCPKSRDGDPFHGSLDEATIESEKRFEKKYGSIPKSEKATDDLQLLEDAIEGRAGAREQLWQRLESLPIATQNAILRQFNEGKKAKEKSLDKSAAEIYMRGVTMHREAPKGSLSDQIELSNRVNRMKREAFAELHGVNPSDVSEVENYFVVEEKDGTRRVYGPKRYSVSKTSDLGYLGVLHPKLTQPARFASESKAMVGDREATPREIAKVSKSRKQSQVKFYSYGTIALKGHGTVEFTSDSDGLPVDKDVWESLDNSKVPAVLFEDESLREAIKNSGIIR